MLLSLTNLDRMMSLMLTYSDKRARGLGQISSRVVRERRREYGFLQLTDLIYQNRRKKQE
jgi:hypothetical protein